MAASCSSKGRSPARRSRPKSRTGERTSGAPRPPRYWTQRPRASSKYKKLLCWVFVITLKCLGEVHRFSAWRALGALVLGALAMFAVVAGVIATIWLAVVVARAML